MPSDQDGVRGQIYPLTKTTNKIDKIYKVAVGKTLTIRQRRTVTIERHKTKERSSMTAWAYWFQSFQSTAQEGVACAESLLDSLNWEDRPESPGDKGSKSFQDRVNWERTLEICKAAQSGIELSTDQHVHVRDLLEVRQRIPQD